MTARIYKPARTAMQSGTAKTKEWVLDYEPEQPRAVEPLMGWTSSGDMKQQLRLLFDTKEEAIAYCERNGIAYQVFESTPPKRARISYSDNFAHRGAAPGRIERRHVAAAGRSGRPLFQRLRLRRRDRCRALRRWRAGATAR